MVLRRCELFVVGEGGGGEGELLVLAVGADAVGQVDGGADEEGAHCCGGGVVVEGGMYM